MSLLQAIETGSLEDVFEMLSSGADPREADVHGVTPLHLATTPGLAEALLDAGADVNARDRYGLAPLHNAVLEGLAPVVEVLCRRGADLHAVEAKGFTPLQMARDYDVPEAAVVLEAHGAEF